MSMYENLKKANSKIKGVSIHGKSYAQVHERINVFREFFDGYSIETFVINASEKDCLISACVKDNEGNVIATGTAYEIKTGKGINSTSHVENCETSAIGRALAVFGIGTQDAIASYDEVKISTQKNDANTANIDNHKYNEVKNYVKSGKITAEKVKEFIINSGEKSGNWYDKNGNNLLSTLEEDTVLMNVKKWIEK